MHSARWILLLLIAGVLAAGCSQGGQPSGTGTTSERGGAGTTAQTTPSPETAAPEQGRSNRGQAPAQERALLRIEGSEGAQFSGSCNVGGQRRQISGTVPESYTFELGERTLECEIRKQGTRDLRIVFSSDASRSVQQVTGENAVLKLSYEDGSLSTSTRSVS